MTRNSANPPGHGRLIFILCGILVWPAPWVSGQNEIPDFTRGDGIPEGHHHDWNLGPSGARGWIYSNRLETTEARQILVTEIEPGSPAAAALQPGDVILGVDGARFSFDPRVELGQAIGRAESSDGALVLTVWREGDTRNATIPLAVLGDYSATAPFDCAKSAAILEQGCAALARKMEADPAAGNKIVRALNTLALLASGREEYLPLIKQQIEWAAAYSDVECRELCCWYYGPINMLLAEYILATGDTTHLPDLQRITMEIVDGQSDVGSWGHRFCRPDGRLNGYGMMNAPGLPLTVSLILAREAGVDDPRLDEAIQRSTRLLRFYVGKGCVPYGDHHPWLETHDDNGKNGIAALMFNLVGDEEAATWFSRMSVASHGAEREMGHTGNYFNMLWAMPGVALSGPDASGAWMEEFGWYYDLARRTDGTFQHQGPAQPKHDSYRNWDSSGAYLLAYAQPLRRLHVTGKKTGLVSPLDPAAAAGLIEDGRDYSHRLQDTVYADRTDSELFEGLSSWSPVVRERAAAALARRDGDFSPRLIEMLKGTDLHSRLGACQAIARLGQRASNTVPQLQQTLEADDLWLRIKAADALAGIGEPARVAVPQLLSMMCRTDPQADPRGMQTRYLCFALFDRRNGLLSGSLEGIDRTRLFEAVRAGLGNQDGRARGVITSVYRNLSYQEIEPLLPEIHRAVVEPAPSGEMFADGIRLGGLEVLARHRIKEGIRLCVDVIEPDRWGAGNRIPGCLQALQQYGAAAAPVLPELRELEQQLANKRRPGDKDRKHIELLQQTMAAIEADTEPPTLRPLPSAGSQLR